MLPNDQHEIKKITSVSKEGDSFCITTDDGWSLYCGDNCPIEPKPGMLAVQYGKGIGFQVRGLFIDGHKFWYRTEAEEKEHHETSMYGVDAADWLRRWDAGDSVWSIEMGGFGPGYEQAIQITAAEVLRWMLENKPDLDSEWAKYNGEMGKVVGKLTEPLGLSGAQWGAAVSLAALLYKDGPRGLMAEPQLNDRHIQVQKNFPQLPATGWTH